LIDLARLIDQAMSISIFFGIFVLPSEDIAERFIHCLSIYQWCY